MRSKTTLLALALWVGTFVPALALASGDHGQPMAMDGGMQATYMEEKDIDGYRVSFHIMTAKRGMEHGGSHNLMVKIEQGGKPITNALVNSKSIHPDGTSESKMMLPMGDWYVAGYDLGHEGQHQLLILFKTADGKKHFGGVYYPNNTSKNSGGTHER